MMRSGAITTKASMRRNTFMLGAATGSLASMVCGWLDWHHGLFTSLPQDLILALALMPLCIWAWRTADPTPPARTGMLIFVCSFIPSIPFELVQMPIFLLWMPAVSLLSFYFFGFREGLIWSGCFFVLVLAESLWVLSGVESFQFGTMFSVALIIYLFLSAAAAAFQYMIESYEQQVLLEAEEKHRVQEQMAEMQKLETIAVLAGGIAHDFNNLLVGVMGNAELAMLDNRQDELRSYLEQIFKSATHGADLVRQMLAYSGQGQISMGRLNLNQLIRDVSKLLGPSIGRQLSLDPACKTTLPVIYGDKNQLMQLIMNLITNASESMQGMSGKIALRTGQRRLSAGELSEMTLISGAEAGDYVYLEVEDTGCGMDLETRARIFEPFFTTKESGSGLGLAALLGIVRSHGGALSLRSEPGTGSCFTVYLPILADDGAAAVKLEAEDEEVLPEPGGLVLVADDEKEVRDVAGDLLVREGLRVLSACDGAQAVDVFRQYANEITLVLLDLTMPEMDGEQAFHAIRAIHPDARVILSSGFPESEAAGRLRSQGLAGFIQKPYQRTTLLNAIARLEAVSAA